jgi:hypothetical protein
MLAMAAGGMAAGLMSWLDSLQEDPAPEHSTTLGT